MQSNRFTPGPEVEPGTFIVYYSSIVVVIVIEIVIVIVPSRSQALTDLQSGASRK